MSISGFIPKSAETNAIPIEYLDFDLSRGIMLFDDFISDSPAGDLGFSSLTFGPDSLVSVDTTYADYNHLGWVRIRSGGAGNRRAVHYLGANNLVVGGGSCYLESLYRIGSLSTVGNVAIFQIGVGNTLTGLDHNDGIYLKYDFGLSINWLAVTASNSVLTTVDTGVPVVAGVNFKIKIAANFDASVVAFYLESPSPSAFSPIAVITTNIPTDVSRKYSFVDSVRTISGSSTHDLYKDYTRGGILFNSRR